MADRPLRVALWCAVSSRPQAADDKTSLDDQRQAGEQFAAAIGGSVVVTYTVPGQSRDFILWDDAAAVIPAYRDLRADCDRRAFDVLHATDADRLGRTAALIHQVIGLVEASGAEVYLASSPHTVGQTTVAQRYVSAIQAVRAEEEQSIRIARHERGMRGRVRRGLHAGTWPYGYVVVRDATGASVGAELVPEEAACVRYMTRRFLEGISYRQIAQELNEAGYPTGGAAEWYGNRVWMALTNDTYAGYPAWRNAQPEEPSPHYHALWDAGTHAAVLHERAVRGYRTSHSSALLDVAFCARCGGRMTRHVVKLKRKTYTYLRCGQHSDHGTCHANHVLDEDARRAVEQFLASALSDNAQIEGLIQAQAEPRADLEAELSALDARQEEIATQRQRLALALAAGGMDVQMYRQTDDALLDELDGVNAARQSAEMRLQTQPGPAQRRTAIDDILEALPYLWEIPPRKAATMLQNVGLYVWCEGGEVLGVEFREIL